VLGEKMFISAMDTKQLKKDIKTISDDSRNNSCELSLYDAIGNLLDGEYVDFYTNAIQHKSKLLL
jgi:hypothetical protein